MRIQVTGETEPDGIEVSGGQPATVIEVAAGLVSAVNGRTGGVTLDAAAVGADPEGAADAAQAAAVSAAAGDATAKVAAHAAAVDPHGDRAYANNLVSVDWINVTKAPYGADSTGTVDASAAIQAAITALGSRGGTVYLPPGDFLLNGSSPINLGAPITIQGAGHGATTIRIGSSFTGSSAITVSSDDCMIQGIQIRGASTTTTSNPACHGITLTGAQEFRVFNTTFQWINGYAIRLFGTAATTLHGTQINMIKVQSCAGGIHIKSDPAAPAANVQLGNIFTRFLGVNSGANANLDGIRIEDSWDVLAQNVMPWMQATLGGTGAAFRVIGNCAAIFVQNLDALGPQTGVANVVIESGTNGDPQNVQIQGGVIQQGIVGILIAGASNQVRVRNMRILNNQTHNVSVTSSGFGIYFDECLISQGGQGATGTNYDISWSGSAEGFITDCRFGTPVVATGTAGVQGIINIATAVVRVLGVNFTGSGSASTNWYPTAQPQLASRVDGSNFEFFGNIDYRFASGQRHSWRPSASGNHVAAINVAGTDVNDRLRIYADRVEIGPGASARDTTWGRQGTAQIGTTDSDVIIGLAGKGLRVKEGTNAKMGTATLNGTTAVVISTTAVTATSRIFLTIQTPNAGTAASPYVSARTAGTSFSVKSTAAGDASTVAWMIIEPA
ncbi:glycosyl hydrolase family 28-related protein [Streptomyces sp. NPDC050564]|uniref:glycosyl hydrolase family 28-related protein n=1 Tax=Streptomyces sp. NPDC050564 TaxID=3365631 RepID=UPI0037962AB7